MNVEYAILADYVDVASNKLYIMGGGWDTLVINNPQLQHSFGIAATFRAKLQELDRPHEVAIQIIHAESGTTFAEIQGSVEFSGGPENAKLESEQAHFGVNLTLVFLQDGLFRLVIRVDGEVGKDTPFLVMYGASVRGDPEVMAEPRKSA